MSTSLPPLLAPMLSSAAMRAICDDVTCLQNMLDFEVALARAEAATGVIPTDAAGPITSAGRQMIRPRRIGGSRDPVRQSCYSPRQGADRKCYEDQSRRRALCALGRDQPGHHRHRHYADPAPRDRCAPCRHRPGDLRLCHTGAGGPPTAVVGRTWLQHALPMPFGLMLAEYAAALYRSQARLKRLRRETLALQFGGAAGTLAALGDKGLVVAERLAQELKLPLPEAPWHTHRDRIAEAALPN